MTKLITTAIAIGATLALVPPALAANRYVDDSGTDLPGCTSPTAPCRTINFAVDQAAAGDTVHIGAASNPYLESVTLDPGISLTGSDFNPPATSFGPPDFNRARIDGGVGFAIVVEPGAARTIEDPLEVYGGPGAIHVDTATGVPTKLTIDGVAFSQVFSPNPDDGRLVLADGPEKIDLTVNEGFWCCPDDGLHRRAIDDVGTNPLDVIVRDSHFQGLQSAIRLTGADALITGNQFILDGDVDPAVRAAIDLTDSSSLIEDNNLYEQCCTADEPPELGVRIDNTGAAADTPILRRNEINEMTVGAVQLTGGAGDGAVIEDSLFLDNPPAGFGEPPYGIDASGLGAGVSAIGLTMMSRQSQISGSSSTLDETAADVVRLEDTHLTLDSSILGAPIVVAGGASCTIRYSRGPTTTGDSCQRFQTSADPGQSLLGGASLTRQSPLLDAGNPAIPGTLDLPGFTRSQDGNGDGVAIRDMGAFERHGITLPDTKILLGPASRTRERHAIFHLEPLGNGYYTCSLDGGTSERCTSPVIYRDLERGRRGKGGKVIGGRHTLSVYATTFAGVELIGSDPTPAVYTWTVLPKKKKRKKKG